MKHRTLRHDVGGTGRRLRQAALLAGAALLSVLVLQGLRKATRAEGIDLGSYLGAADALLAGLSPYAVQLPFPYLYPPAFAALMIPLALLPYLLAAALWMLGSAAALVATLRGLWRSGASGAGGIAAGPGALSSGRWLALAAPGLLVVLVFLRVLQSNFANGQVNVLVLALCWGCFAAWQAGRRVGAVALLAIAIQTKAIPALLLLFLLLRRDWRTLGGTLALVLLLSALSSLAPGPGGLALHREFVQTVVLGRGLDAAAFSHTAGGEPLFFTVRGALAWLLPGAAAVPALRYAGPILTIVLLLGVERLLHRRGAAAQAAAFAAYLLAMLLVSPMSEKHHLVFALPAAGLPVFGLAAGWSGPRAAVALLLLGGATLLHLGGLWPGGPLYFAALLLLLLAGVVVWARGAPALPEARSPAQRPSK